MRTVLLFSACLGAACAAPPPPIELSDVTLAWPLATDGDGFLRAASAGDHGELLPRAWFDAIPKLTRTDEPDALYDGLQVVAARLDPCFREGGTDAPCRANVRLVLQPVVVVAGATVARDAAIHAFYDAVDADEIAQAVAALARARVEAGHDGRGPLGVHPLLEAPRGRATIATILAPLLGEGRFVRATSTAVHAGDEAWTFSGFDVVDGEAAPIVIPATGGEVEQHATSTGGRGPIDASVIPALAASDDITLLLDDDDARAATAAARQAAYDAAARIENPTLHDPGTIDCASCHLAAPARAAARAREAMAASPGAYASTRHDLTPTTYADTEVVRALGYRFGALAIAPRVAHESAAVADAVDAILHP